MIRNDFISQTRCNLLRARLEFIITIIKSEDPSRLKAASSATSVEQFARDDSSRSSRGGSMQIRPHSLRISGLRPLILEPVAKVVMQLVGGAGRRRHIHSVVEFHMASERRQRRRRRRAGREELGRATRGNGPALISRRAACRCEFEGLRSFGTSLANVRRTLN